MTLDKRVRGIQAKVILDRWSGHGGGGTVVKIQLDIPNWKRENIYMSTEQDKIDANIIADYVSQALYFYEDANS